jgi:CheY-like chemotaxis protein
MANPVHCMIVDDDSTSRAMTGIVLKKYFGEEMRITRVSSGKEAILAISGEQFPNLVLMDVRMPVMDGVQTTRVIRQLQGLNPILIVGVTGMDDERTLRNCKEAGMDLVLTKPVREQELKSLTPLLQTMMKRLGATEKIACLVDESLLEGIDAEMRSSLLAEWRSTLVDQLRKLQECSVSCDWKEAEDIAHTIKGSSSQIGAVQISQAARSVEAVARSHVPSAVEMLDHVKELYCITSRTFQHLGLEPLEQANK